MFFFAINAGGALRETVRAGQAKELLICNTTGMSR
jgi:hypothetical protein